MRNGQNNNKRMRNRNNNNNNNNNNNRRGQNPMTRVFESNGPDIKIRGTASHVAEKYVQLARDARSSGDPVAAENYYQHAEHYFRLIAAAQEQFRQNQPQPRTENEMPSEDSDEEARIFRISARSPASFRRSRSRSCRATTSARASPTSRASSSPANTTAIATIARRRSINRNRSPSRSLSRLVTAAASIVCRPSSPGRNRRSMAASSPAAIKGVASASSRAAAAVRTGRVPRAWPHRQRRATISIRGMSRRSSVMRGLDATRMPSINNNRR